MRILLLAGAALALSACGGANDTQAEDGNSAGTENMIMDTNTALDPAMNGAANMALDPAMNGMGNGADPATQNMVQQDLNTNDPDTNLANGL